MSKTISYLFIPDIIRAGGCWFLHGNQAEHLEQVVLHDISDQNKREQAGGQTKDREEDETAVSVIIKTDHRFVLMFC